MDGHELIALCAPRPVFIGAGAAIGGNAGDIAFREHSGAHTDVPNWPAFLEFAGHYIKGPGLKPSEP